MSSELQELALQTAIAAEYEDRLNETLTLHPMLPHLVASVRVMANMIRKERERLLRDRGCINDSL